MRKLYLPNANFFPSELAGDMNGDEYMDIPSTSWDDKKIVAYLNAGISHDIESPQEIVFIDSNVEDYESLANGVLPGIKVVILDSSSDGFGQVTRVIQKYPHISSIHIVSHGGPGYLCLGNGQFNINSIDNNHTKELEAWSVSNLLLYGCNVAAGDSGAEFIEKLHQLTGANIAASARLTGNVALGGDWELEVIRGELNVDVPFTQETQQQWDNVLVDIVSINAAGTPTEAGATPGTFTIDRGADTTGDITVFFTISGTAQQNIDYDIQGVRTVENTIPAVTFDGKKGSVVIPDGQTSVEITIVPRDDVVADGGETVTLTLTEEPTGAAQQYDVSSTSGDETATLTITDNTNPSSKVVGANEITISTNALGARSVFTADVDGDGDVDLVSGWFAKQKIVLHLNNGSNKFTEKTISTNASAPQSVFAADVDGDRDVDVLSSASSSDDKIALYLNDGSNNFKEKIISTNADHPESVFAADVDGDGDVDVISSTTKLDGKMALYVNDGSNNFTEHTIATNANDARSVFAADVDGDGDVDVLSASTWDHKIALYLNDGSNKFTEHPISTNTRGARSVFAADVDGDGDVDLLSAEAWDNKIGLYLNEGSNKFTEHTISANAHAAASVFAADVDGDGDVDVLSAEAWGDKISLYLNEGSNKFTKHTISTADGAYSVFAVDVDGDGDVDVLSASYSDNKIALYETVSVDLQLDNTTIDENATPNSVVGQFPTTDPDNGDSFTYALVSGTGDTDNSAFTISGNQLQINTTPDFENQSSYIIRVETTDGSGASYQKQLTINVNDVNEAPTDLLLDNTTLDENATPNSVVGQFSTTDPDNGDSFTYALVSGTGDTDNSAFTISGNQLQINTTPDFESQSSYSIRVETTDGSGASYQKQLTINVNDVNSDTLNLQFEWAKQNGGSSSDVANSITTDSSGNVLVGGDFQGDIDIDGDGNNDLTSNGSYDGYAAKFDSNGNLVWAKQNGGSSSDVANSITTDSSGNVLVGGDFYGDIDIDGDDNNDFTSNGSDGYAAKFDSNGNLVWAKQIGGSSDDRARSITTDSSGNVLVGGDFQGDIDIDDDGNNDFTSKGSLDGYAAKFDSNGNLVWAKQIGGSSDDYPYSITTDSSGNVLVGGDFEGNIDIDGDGDNDLTSNGSYDGYAAKLDSNGNLVWAKQIGGSSDDYPYSITTDNSGNVLVEGDFEGNIDIDGDGNNDLTSNGSYDVFFVKFSDDTNSPPTDLDLDNKTIDENVAPNSVVGTFSTTDPDSGDSFTYTLVTGDGDTDNSAFTIKHLQNRK